MIYNVCYAASASIAGWSPFKILRLALMPGTPRTASGRGAIESSAIAVVVRLRAVSQLGRVQRSLTACISKPFMKDRGLAARFGALRTAQAQAIRQMRRPSRTRRVVNLSPLR
jgi:hypothetical protein